MIVSGAAKAAPVRAARKEPDDVMRWPVHVLRAANDRVEWLVDEAAASQL
jgi:6-phosphogluconolactonase/glucosamine-6-phosphate isomerase/deaminase